MSDKYENIWKRSNTDTDYMYTHQEYYNVTRSLCSQFARWSSLATLNDVRLSTNIGHCARRTSTIFTDVTNLNDHQITDDCGVTSER